MPDGRVSKLSVSQWRTYPGKGMHDMDITTVVER